MKSFAKFLPSKYFRGVLLSLVFVFVLVGASYALAQKKNTDRADSKTSELLAEGVTQNSLYNLVAEKDEDNDGLKDWEENLWGTDPNKADSDFDGTPDGEEVTSNRNPALAGPDDQLNINISVDGKTPIITDEKLTETDILARNAFVKYLEAKQGGNEITAETSSAIASSVIKQGAIKISGRLYADSDIIISNNNDQKSLREYGMKMGAVILKYPAPAENEIEILKRALEENSPNELKKIDKIIFNYEHTLADALLVSVPKESVSIHLTVLNRLSDMVAILKAFRGVFDNPATGLSAYGSYPQAVSSMGLAFLDVHNFFERKLITFTKNESGFAYANIVQ